MTLAVNPVECRRCGTCCRKGGPSLHLEDHGLVESGKIPLKHIFTIRQGEPAYDNLTGTVAPAVTDIIKIRGVAGGSDACCFYDASQKRCGIYNDRPLECRALKCWDTREIERIYKCRRLTRRHLLSNIEGLWELVQDHQARCNYNCVAELASQLKQLHSPAQPRAKLLELIRYDDSLRQITHERSKLDPQMLLFLFGRPLSFTIRMFQLEL